MPPTCGGREKKKGRKSGERGHSRLVSNRVRGEEESEEGRWVRQEVSRGEEGHSQVHGPS